MDSILITGITGFIGSLVAKKLLKSDSYCQGKLHIIGVARNAEKAEYIFADYNRENIEIVSADICNRELFFSALKEQPVDYLIHCAAITASKEMISHPVETADGIVMGTRNMLEFARIRCVKSMVFLSSMEVYGSVPEIGRTRREEELGDIAISLPRSCYPLGKRMAEHYCSIYHKEYGVPVKIARLSQTFGKGVRTEDKRVFMQFAYAVIQKKDIVLKTQGLTLGNYCDSMDVVNTIFLLLQHGENGEVYNVVNEDNTMSIREMAQMVVDKFANGKIQVKIEEEALSKTGYAPNTSLRMSSAKLCALGWKPTKNLEQMYRDVIYDLQFSNHNENAIKR